MSIGIGILESSRSGAALLLDTYPGAAAAYSLRKLRTAYTGSCIRVYKQINGSQIDIGFVNNVLDTTTLLTFAGGNDLQVLTWYDQSGNGNNLTASPAAPKIVIAGVLQTQNSKPCIRTGGTNGQGWNITTPIAANTNISIFMTAKGDSLASLGPCIAGPSTQTTIFGYFPSSIGSQYALGAGLNGVYRYVSTVPNYANTNYLIYNCIVNSTANYIYQNNNTFIQSFDPAPLNQTTFTQVGRYFTFITVGIFSEIIIYKTDQLSNRAAIVDNTNSFYTIF